MTDGSSLCTVGISYPLAAEIGRQMTSGIGNADLFCKLGLNAGPAIELARQINTGTFSAHLLTLAMWNPVTAGGIKTLGTATMILPTNLLTKTEQLASWTLSSVTVPLSNVAANPLDAAVTVERVIETTATLSHSINCPVAPTFANATVYTFSFYVKFETRQFMQLLLGSAAFGSNAYANFDIQNGTVQTVGSSAVAAIVAVGSGWYRISVTATSTAGASAVCGLFFVQTGSSARAESYTGVVTNTALAYGAQIETGSTANTYVAVA